MPPALDWFRDPWTILGYSELRYQWLAALGLLLLVLWFVADVWRKIRNQKRRQRGTTETVRKMGYRQNPWR